jgi:hypothetical protein
MNDDIENRPDLNSRKKWSQIALLDLANCIRLNDPIEEIARFLCRSQREVRKKIAELQQSGELPRLIDEVAALEVPEEPEPGSAEAEST